jgi:hypothetical protein
MNNKYDMVEWLTIFTEVTSIVLKKKQKVKTAAKIPQ